MPTRRDCKACYGLRHSDRLFKRVALSEVAANHSKRSDRHLLTYGCKQCNVSFCKKGESMA
jgi:hypothetical protein